MEEFRRSKRKMVLHQEIDFKILLPLEYFKTSGSTYVHILISIARVLVYIFSNIVITIFTNIFQKNIEVINCFKFELKESYEPSQDHIYNSRA